MERLATAANANGHDQLFFQVVRALTKLRNGRRRISFYSVAEQSQVARSTLYRRSDLRQLVMSARSDPDGFIPAILVEPIKEDNEIVTADCGALHQRGMESCSNHASIANEIEPSELPAVSADASLHVEETANDLLARIAALENALAHLLFERDAEQETEHRSSECRYAIVDFCQAA